MNLPARGIHVTGIREGNGWRITERANFAAYTLTPAKDAIAGRARNPQRPIKPAEIGRNRTKREVMQRELIRKQAESHCGAADL